MINKELQLINENNHSYPFIISIPHSGTLISKNMNENLIENVILTNTDWYLPKLYEFLKDMGFTVIINQTSRYMIDPNRSINDKTSDSLYNKSLIYTKTTFNKDIYQKALSQNEIEERINNYYIPYHKELEKALKEKLKYFDKVYLLDLHSFGKNVGADIVLGNNNGSTTSNDFFELVKNNLEECGFKVNDNTPYKGGFITRNYKEKLSNCETLQIELWYQAYIDNREFLEEYEPNINEQIFQNAQNKMIQFFEKLKNIQDKNVN
ncbi:MAG: N-formylglutamate amidohydrolase [Clostridia bacterium]|nr:N-formylglutamate amidohydrolase [Clostridia bacterium]